MLHCGLRWSEQVRVAPTIELTHEQQAELTRLATGRYVNGTIHRLAIVGRAEGQAWPVTMREIYQDFQRGA